ncbi:putative spore protein YtfJ [Bacillus sp. THAF10]|uniref:GerW family sporulation protein n=1 Tax=Bacillus sp. THAF10 TaxID=2587848 RepID=UPI00126799CF|nr:GerW family sporulation protein [Bacillus sp. THAF10]QFT90187.1 putative spore protein YtfJ [Bacillus sp. THAF10]
MSEHPIKSLMTTAMENLKDMIDVNTIIGDPVETPDGSVILTVSKVGFGFAAGGSEFKGSTGSGPEKQQDGQSQQNQQGGGHKLPFGGGSGGGVSITPIAFLIVNSHGVKMLHLDESTHLYERLLDLAPQAVEKIQHILNNNKRHKGSHSGSNYSDHKQDDLDF